jgi:hypothetical protein
MTATKPKITLMGEEIDYDSLPEPDAVDLADHFKPVKLSPRAIDEASKIVPSEVGLRTACTWLSKAANFVFSKLSASQRWGRMGKMKYEFGFDADGPVLLKVSLG